MWLRMMGWIRKAKLRFRALFQKKELDERMDHEMRLHIEMQTQENIEAGMKPEEARYAALRQFGWVQRDPTSQATSSLSSDGVKTPGRDFPRCVSVFAEACCPATLIVEHQQMTTWLVAGRRKITMCGRGKSASLDFHEHQLS